MTGIVVDLQGHRVEVEWCLAQWQAYHAIINDVIKLSIIQNEAAMKDANDLKQAVADIKQRGSDFYGLLFHHLPPTTKGQAALKMLDQVIDDACDTLKDFYLKKKGGV